MGPKPITNPNNAFSWGTAPFSGRVTAIAINSSNPSNIYLGAANGGVWKSLDGGSTWTPITDSQSSLAIGAITISSDGKTVYAGTGEPNHSGDSYYGDGLLKSTDGGKSWTLLGSSTFSTASISGIVIDQSTKRITVSTTWGICCKYGGSYVGYTSQSALGIFVSNDGGSTWSNALSSPSNGIAQLLVDPTTSSVIYAADFTGAVWASTDTGSTWKQLLSINDPLFQGRVTVAASAALPHTIFAAYVSPLGELAAFVKFDTQTAIQTTLGVPPTPPGQISACNLQCWYDLLLVSDQSNANYLYFGSIDLYRSSDGGNSWIDVGGYAGTLHPDQHGFAFLPGSNSTIFSGNDGGIWKSTDRGTTWTNLNNGLGITQFESITGSPSGLMFGGTQDNGCSIYTGTSSWSFLVGGDGGWSGFESSNPTIMYCNYAHLEFRKSTDGGSSWAFATTGIDITDHSTFYAPVAQDPNTPGTLYIAGTHVYKTTNFAQNWNDVSGSLGSSPITALAVAPSNSNWVYLGDSTGAVKLSQDGGSTWLQILSPQNEPINGFAVDPTTPSVVYVAIAGTGLSKVSLVGSSWQSVPLNPPVPAVNVVRLDPATKDIYIGTDKGVYLSIDSGSTWATAGTGLPNSPVFDLIFVAGNHTLVAATHGRGVWSLVVTQGIVMTLSYSVKGGGTGYSPPTFSYTSGRQSKTVPLTGTPTPFALDKNTSWSVTTTLAGSTTNERWQTKLATNGTAATQTIVFPYYHQFLDAFGFSVVGGGSGYAPPTFTAEQHGANTSLNLGSSWVDSGSPYVYQTQLQGSSSSERWLAASPTGSVSSATAVTEQYYHQYSATVGYSVTGGGMPSAPTFSFNFLGANVSIGLTGTPKSFWADSGNFSVTDPLVGSNATERWFTASGSGRLSSSATLSVAYSHQYHLDVSGGSVPEQWFDVGSTAMVTTSGVSGRSGGVGIRLVSYRIDGGAATQVTPATGTITIPVLMNAPHSLVLSTVQQFELILDAGAQHSLSSLTQPTIAGDNYWYDTGTTVTYTGNGVFGRAAGSGGRAKGWSVDSGTSTGVGTVGTYSTNPVLMSASHTVHVTTVTQYQVTLDQGSTGALKSITPPTLAQDNYWYDAGTSVKVDFNGVWNRAAGTGSRLVSYSINGGSSTAVSTGGAVTALSTTIASAQSISTVAAVQFLLDTPSGSLASVTPPTIQNDAGWYDSGTPIKAVYDYVWNATQNSRVDATGFNVDGGSGTSLARSGNGTFAASVTMDKPHTINVGSVVQFMLSISGGSGVTSSVPSPTGDTYYDAGASVSASAARTWNVQGGSRQRLSSYTLDGLTSNVTGTDALDFTTPPITMNQYHALTFNQVTQYLVSFRFTDDSGTKSISPTTVQINVKGTGVQTVAGSKTWVDSGMSFTFAKLIWENADIKPTNQIAYTVGSPLNATIHTRVFDAKLRVTDLFGQPVSGASVSLLLANGTRLDRATGSDGTLTIPLIPLGTFSGTAMNLGVSSQVSGDASSQPISEGKVSLSIPVLGVIAVVIIVALAGAFLGIRSRRMKKTGGQPKNREASGTP